MTRSSIHHSTVAFFWLAPFILGAISSNQALGQESTSEGVIDGEPLSTEVEPADEIGATETEEPSSETAPPEEQSTPAAASEQEEPPEAEDVEPPTSSGPPHCHGQSESTWALHDTIGLRMNSLGLANSLRGSYCWALFTDREGILFALSNLEIGLVNHLAPAYVHGGAFISFTPISLLSLSVEATGFYVWPLSLTNSGYLAREAYDDDFESGGIVQYLENDEEVTNSSGLNIVLNLTARGRITLAEMRRGALHLLISNTLGFEYWLNGDQSYNWNLKVDAILGRSDWFLSNTAVVLLAFPLSERHNLRVGLFDELLYSLGWPGLERHQIGGIVGINVSRLGRIRGFETVLVLTGMTHLTSRTLRIPSINVMAKISIPIPL